MLLRCRGRGRLLLRAKGVQALEHLCCLSRHIPSIAGRHRRHAQQVISFWQIRGD